MAWVSPNGREPQVTLAHLTTPRLMLAGAMANNQPTLPLDDPIVYPALSPVLALPRALALFPPRTCVLAFVGCCLPLPLPIIEISLALSISVARPENPAPRPSHRHRLPPHPTDNLLLLNRFFSSSHLFPRPARVDLSLDRPNSTSLPTTNNPQLQPIILNYNRNHGCYRCSDPQVRRYRWR